MKIVVPAQLVGKGKRSRKEPRPESSPFMSWDPKGGWGLGPGVLVSLYSGFITKTDEKSMIFIVVGKQTNKQRNKQANTGGVTQGG